jgi:hypothetical protein
MACLWHIPDTEIRLNVSALVKQTGTAGLTGSVAAERVRQQACEKALMALRRHSAARFNVWFRAPFGHQPAYVAD